MKKLLTMIALAIFSLAVVSCNNKKEETIGTVHTLSAEKASVQVGGQISFTITGATTEQNWQICGAGQCYSMLKFTDNKTTIKISNVASDFLGEQEFYATSTSMPKEFKTNIVKVKIEKAQ